MPIEVTFQVKKKVIPELSYAEGYIYDTMIQRRK